MSWFEKLIPSRIGTGTRTRGNVPEGLWVKCEGCSTVLYRAELERGSEVCDKCGSHMRMNARARLDHLLDADGREELAETISPVDTLKFKDSKRYKDRLTQATKASGEKDALIVMRGRIKGVAVVVAVFDFRFMGGSMGSVVGEKFARAAECCLENSLPLVCFSASGGARMQEALFSLLQMGKTSSVLAQMSSRGLPYISVLTDPTMGGVSASLAMLGDVIIAEPGARIGFAGPRVIEQTVREKLPEGFQSSEFLLEHGAIDMIVDRREMRDKLGSLLSMMLHRPAPRIEPNAQDGSADTHEIDASSKAENGQSDPEASDVSATPTVPASVGGPADSSVSDSAGSVTRDITSEDASNNAGAAAGDQVADSNDSADPQSDAAVKDGNPVSKASVAESVTKKVSKAVSKSVNKAAKKAGKKKAGNQEAVKAGVNSKKPTGKSAAKKLETESPADSSGSD